MVKRESRVRLDFMVMPEVKRYVDEQAREYGMSVGAYVTMIIQQNRQQTNVLETMAQMVKKLDESGKQQSGPAKAGKGR